MSSMHVDTARPMDNASSTPPSPPSGPMTRSRAKAIHDKVNSFLYMCDLDPTMNGMLPHANALCILRYEPQPRQHGCIEDGQVSKKKQPDSARVSAAHRPEYPPPPESAPCASRTLRLPCFDPNAPECDNTRHQNRRLAGYFHPTRVSAPTGLSGAHRPETPA